jgi:hypothetical protein
MEIKALFGILSSILVLMGGFPYLKDIYYEKAHPHILSWIGWSFITALGAFAMLADGGTWAVAILFANTALCLVVAVYSAYKKVGVWSVTKMDGVYFGLGIIGLLLWKLLDLPVIALICAIGADFAFGLPTIIKTYKHPKSETTFVWITASLSGLCSLFAIQSFAFHEIAYPLYLFIYDTTVLLLALNIINKKDPNRV